MTLKHLAADLSELRKEPIRIAYYDHSPEPSTSSKGTILLLHGFPQTSHQFRHVLSLFSASGYRTIAPDYRGAGNSSKPSPSTSNYLKTAMAADLIALLDHLSITEPVHVLGHDIGGMVAYALTSRYPSRVRSVCWGECPLPGTEWYSYAKTLGAVKHFHFILHSMPDLAESLIVGGEREKAYIEHFFTEHGLTYDLDAFGAQDMGVYVDAYARPGAMRAAFETYRAFEQDAAENLEWLEKHGKCDVPCLMLTGEFSHLRPGAEDMGAEVFEKKVIRTGVVKQAGHYVAEENPQGFVDTALRFLNEVQS